MKKAYPVIFTQGEKFVVAYVPDLDINTQGTDWADAISMARDAIGLFGLDRMEDGLSIPEPSTPGAIPKPDNGTLALVDIDFDAYRRAHDMKTVRKNLTLPSWLNDMAESAGVNFSQVLQDGLKQRLGVQDRR